MTTLPALQKVLKILDQYKIPATFFIVADVIEHYRSG